LGDNSFVPLIPIGFLTMFVTFMVYVFVPPLASRTQIATERTWIGSLPFPIEGYFDALAQEPRIFGRVQIDLVWRTAAADAGTLQGVFGVIDTDARVSQLDATTASVTTGTISGATGIRINGVPVYRNHNLAKYLHRLVDTVLLPLDRSVGLARVRLTRTH